MGNNDNAKQIQTIVKWVAVFYMLLNVLIFSDMRAEAKTVLIPTTNVHLFKFEGSSYTFTLSKAQYVQIVVTEEWDYYTEDRFLDIGLVKSDGVQSFGEDNYTWYDSGNSRRYSNSELLKPGKHTMLLENYGDYGVNITFTVYAFDNPSNVMKFNGKKTVKAGVQNKIGRVMSPNERLPYIGTVRSSNKKIADPDGIDNLVDIDPNGTILLRPIRPGKVTLTFKLKNSKKTYKRTYTVTPPDPDFEVYITSYNTRNNYYTIRFKNYGPGNLTILSGSKMMHDDYKVYDRTLKGGSFTIKSKTKKTVRLYANGSLTYPDIEAFTYLFRFSYFNKTYSGRAYYDGADCSQYKKGKRWVDTTE